MHFEYDRNRVLGFERDGGPHEECVCTVTRTGDDLHVEASENESPIVRACIEVTIAQAQVLFGERSGR